MKNETPEKPEKQKDQVSMLWDAVWNHIPSQLAWQDKKLNFILAFMAMVMIFLGVLAALVVVPILK